MYTKTSHSLEGLAKRVGETALEVLWTQWASIGGLAAARDHAESIVDPEALLLLSIGFREQDRRLWDLVADWARVGSRYLSVQRIGNLLPAYPEVTEASLREFASLAHRLGKDHRWKKYAEGATGVQPHREKHLVDEPTWDMPSTLMLRLRLGVGVGIKADILTFLIGAEGSSITARSIAAAIHYTEPAVRRALEAMAKARLVFAAAGVPAEYHVNGPAWKRVLDLPRYPRWLYWHEVFSFVAQFLTWELQTHIHPTSEYARLVRYRQFLSDYRVAFARHRLVPEARPRAPELGHAKEFEDLVAQLMEKIAAAV
jgi:hypothetical protein